MSAEITVRWLEPGGVRVGGAADLAKARSAGSAVWVDVLRPDEASLAPLAAELGLHPLQVEDCLHFPQRPKTDSYGDSIMITWNVVARTDGDGLIFREIDCVLGSGFILTSHMEPIALIETVAEGAAASLDRGAEWTLHALLDRSVDEVFPAIDYVADELDALEDEFLGATRQRDLQRLYALKRMLVVLHRDMSAARDAVRALARQEALISQEAYLYFQDVGDHLARAADGIDTYRDVASGAMDIYLTSQSNRLNEIMKRLTVVATIFMPLTLISGIFGMNVTRDMLPPVAGAWSFRIVIGLMLVVAIGMWWDFRRREWW